MKRKLHNLSGTKEDEPTKLHKLSVNKYTLGQRFHDFESKYPESYKWPTYFPSSATEEREPTHVLVIGETGSCKSERVANLPVSRGGLIYDSLWFITDMESALAIKIKKKIGLMLQHGEHKNLYKASNSNFKLNFLNSAQFVDKFNFTQVNKFVMDSKSHQPVPQHTVIVIDDSSLPEKMIHRLADRKE